MRPDHPNSGLGAFLFGIIALVFSAVALSGFVDKRRSDFKRLAETKSEIESNAAKLDRLEAIHNQRTGELAAKYTGAQENFFEFESLSQSLKREELSIADSKQQIRQLVEEIDHLEKQFSDYRSIYRTLTRNAAIGKSLGTLTLRNGRKYQDCFIVKVTDIGLEIRHKDGTARIHAPDLDASMQDLYQWNREERLNQIKAERKHHNSMMDAVIKPTATPNTGTPGAIRNPSPPSRDNAEMVLLQENIDAWQRRVSQLRIQLNDALDSIRIGNRGTGPGGLETWRDRVSSLTRELKYAHNQIAEMNAKLFAMAQRTTIRPNGDDRSSPP